MSVDAEQELSDAVNALLHGGQLPHNLELVPSSARAKVARMEVAGEAFYLKVHLSSGSIMERLKERIRGSRAARARRAALELEHCGFATAEVVMIGETANASWMISRAIDGIGLGFYAHAFLRPPVPSRERLRWKRQILSALGDYVGRLHAAGIVHGDLRLNNILINGHAPEPSFSLIDNERNMRFRHYMPRRLRIKNLVQVILFHPPIVSRSDRLRFYQSYCEAIGLSSARKQRLLARATEKKYQERYATFVPKQRPYRWEIPENASNVPV